MTINNQGLVDILEAALTELEAKHSYMLTLALANEPDGKDELKSLASFPTNPRGQLTRPVP